MRGNLIRRPVFPVNPGSIPACAGEPGVNAVPGYLPGVYPRVCGGTPHTHTDSEPTPGLSPRVRGNRVGHHHHIHAAGSIPACAGEPAELITGRKAGTVYPRVCGGTPGRPNQSGAPKGLSPRVRGNPGRPNQSGAPEGSIPACAGEPVDGAGAPGSATVYPRVCGGTKLTAPRPWQCHGLSPRVRGNQVCSPPSGGMCGSIPACAGEP